MHCLRSTVRRALLEGLRRPELYRLQQASRKHEVLKKGVETNGYRRCISLDPGMADRNLRRHLLKEATAAS